MDASTNHLRRVLTTLFWDSAPGLAMYIVARLLGASPLAALVASSVATFVRAIVVSVRLRRVDGVALLILATLVVSGLLTFVTGSPRLLLIKDSLVTSVSGVAFIVSAFTQAPLAWQFLVRSAGAEGSEYRQHWNGDPSYRRSWRTITAVWGIGLSVEALARIPVVLWLPFDQATIFSSLLPIPIVLGLAGWTLWYRRRGSARQSDGDEMKTAQLSAS